MGIAWYYRDSGREVGPITAQDLRKKALGGQISPETHVRKGKDGTWTLARNVKGLFDEASSSSKAVPPGTAKSKDAAATSTGAATPPGTPNNDSDDGIYALAAPIETPRQPFNFSGVNSPRFASSRSSSRDNRSGKNYRALRAVARFYRLYGFLSLFSAAIGVLLLAGLIAAMMGWKAQLGPLCQIAVISVVAGIIQGVFAFAIAEAIILAIDLESNTRTTNVLLRKVIESAR